MRAIDIEPHPAEDPFRAAYPQGSRWWSVLRHLSVLAGTAVLVAAAVVGLRFSALESPPPLTGGSAAAAGEPALSGGGAAGGGAVVGSATSPTQRIDPHWVERVADATGIPARAVLAYAAADLVIDAEQPGCGIGWNTVAGIGSIESAHGTHGDRVLTAAGYSDPAIRGVALDGDGVAAIADTDGGTWDGDAVWDRAVGPLQFIPDTWSRWGADGNGDGAADPNQIDDAALATARYLCASGSMSHTQGWRDAVFSYNHLGSYVDDVAEAATLYAERAASVS